MWRAYGAKANVLARGGLTGALSNEGKRTGNRPLNCEKSSEVIVPGAALGWTERQLSIQIGKGGKCEARKTESLRRFGLPWKGKRQGLRE
jgi:hypothetical protein